MSPPRRPLAEVLRWCWQRRRNSGEVPERLGEYWAAALRLFPGCRAEAASRVGQVWGGFLAPSLSGPGSVSSWASSPTHLALTWVWRCVSEQPPPALRSRSVPGERRSLPRRGAERWRWYRRPSGSGDTRRVPLTWATRRRTRPVAAGVSSGCGHRPAVWTSSRGQVWGRKSL